MRYSVPAFAIVMALSGTSAHALECPSTISADELVKQKFTLDYVGFHNQPRIKGGVVDGFFYSNGKCICGIEVPIIATIKVTEVVSHLKSKTLSKFLDAKKLTSGTCPPSQTMIEKPPYVACFNFKASVCKGSKS